jgi:hypothetical protein
MTPKLRLLLRNEHGITPILELVIAITIIFIILSFFFGMLNNFYIAYERPDIDLQAKAFAVCEQLITSPGQTIDSSYSWEETPEQIKSLGLAASPLVNYGGLTLTDDNKILELTRYTPPQGNVSGLMRTCFLAGTPVVMANGTTKNIEEIHCGDSIASYDPAARILVPKTVTQVFQHDPSEMGEYYLVINHRIRVTPDHMLYTQGSWRTFGNLQVGDRVSSTYITSIEKVYKREATFNLEIEGTHTYLIACSNTPLVVHNEALELSEVTNLEFNHWLPVSKEIYPEDPLFETYGSTNQLFFLPLGYLGVGYFPAIGTRYSNYYVEYTLMESDPDVVYLYEAKETINTPYIVLDTEKCNTLDAIEYDTARSLIGLDDKYVVYNFNIQITDESGIVSEYGASYANTYISTSVTRDVLLYHKPVLVDLDTITPPYYTKGQITLRLFIGGTTPHANPAGGRSENQPPEQPTQPSGVDTGFIAYPYTFTTSTTDPDGNQVKYGWDWGDGSPIEWTGFYDSGLDGQGTHSWASPGTYQISVIAEDDQGLQSVWSISHPLAIYWGEYYREISIEPGQVHGTLTNYPVYISLTDEELGHVAQEDGGDIIFTDADGTQLAHEIEYFYRAGNQLVAWVDVPTVTSSERTVLYMYYGNAFCENQQDSPAVWDSNYHGVWHLSELSGDIVDSTGNGNDGTPFNGPKYNVEGIIAGAMQFDGGSNQYISCGDQDSLDFKEGDFTLECWVKTAGTTDQDILSKLEDFKGNQGYALTLQSSGERMGALLYDGAQHKLDSGSAQINKDEWHYLVVTFDRDENGIYYCDGEVDQKTDIHSWNGATSTDQAFEFCRTNLDGMDTYFSGILDEARISDSVRSEDWIWTCYSNIGDIINFLDIGEEKLYSDV